MKKLTSAFLTVLALILVTAGGALADDARTITVTGSAVVLLEPDYAQLEMGVETQSGDVSEAQAENARIMDAVIAALKNAGCEDKDMKTTDFNVYSSYRYDKTADGQQTGTVVYHVSNTLKVTVRDLEKAGSYIDAAAGAGANQMNSLTFLSHDTDAAYTQALQEACADAQSKAGTIAAALGVTLKEVRQVSIPQYAVPQVYNNSLLDRKAAGEAEETAIIAGSLSVSASVEIVFEIK